MGCCLFALVATVWPRVALIFIWLFAGEIPATVFQTTIWPLLGFLLLPATTLTYEMIKYHWKVIDSPLALVLLALALLHDLGQLGVGSRRRSQPG